MDSFFIEMNSDQRRETVNTQQRFQAWRNAVIRHKASRGSMVWSTTRGRDYLMRSGYDKQGRRRQVSLGPRSDETERVKTEFEHSRDEAASVLRTVQSVMLRQSAVNRALGLGRVPLLSARIIRAIDDFGLLGAGIRVLGTNAIYAYEAVAGVRIDPGLTTTEDIDLLLDARRRLSFVLNDDVDRASLLHLLQKVDKSFERSPQQFRAVNDEGYLVDLMKPLRNPPWHDETAQVAGDPDNLSAVEIAGLSWHENAPPFEATAIDERGGPLRIVTSDPRVFAAHKFWLAKRADREPIKRRRDLMQAQCVALLVATYMPQLAFEPDQLRMVPRQVIEEARSLFEATDPGPDRTI
jgi:hypothetical protein